MFLYLHCRHGKHFCTRTINMLLWRFPSCFCSFLFDLFLSFITFIFLFDLFLSLLTFILICLWLMLWRQAESLQGIGKMMAEREGIPGGATGKRKHGRKEKVHLGTMIPVMITLVYPLDNAIDSAIYGMLEI